MGARDGEGTRLIFPWRLDGEKGFGGKGTSGFLRLKHHLNHFGEDEAGPAQGFSNIDAPSRTTLYEAWMEQRLFSDRLRVKAGKIDANSEFAAVPTAGDFLNSSMGFSPTIVGFPSYPLPKAGYQCFSASERQLWIGSWGVRDRRDGNAVGGRARSALVAGRCGTSGANQRRILAAGWNPATL